MQGMGGLREACTLDGGRRAFRAGCTEAATRDSAPGRRTDGRKMGIHRKVS